MTGIEIDFLPVGEGERSGDAIALRYGEEGDYIIHVVDGGSQDSGAEMVDHINGYYNSPRYIDYVVCTHADDDHSSGLRTVIDNFDIGGIWMNRPWLYAAEVVHLFRDQRWTVEGLERRLRQDFPILAEIEATAAERGIPVFEAFQGGKTGAFTILAPRRERYLELIPQFSRTPEAARSVQRERGLGTLLTEAARRAVAWVRETWGEETLEENVETTASNESSVIQYGVIDGRKVLLTGDAGVISLHEAADCAELLGVELPGLRFMQVPHHGSRRNVSPSSLNRWLGEAVDQGTRREVTAFVSSAKKSDTHPRRKVVNAFTRRGARVFATNGQKKWHHYQMPERDDFVSVEPYEFFSQVEG